MSAAASAGANGWLEANGLRFRALRSGGAGRAALFLHATSFCADTWLPVWRAARAAGWRGAARAVDQRGHGRSDAPAEPRDYGWDRLSEDAAALLASQPAETGAARIAVGHSSGATALLAAAGRHPERVAGLLLVEPVLFDPPRRPGGDSFSGSGAFAAAARRRRPGFASRADAARRLRSRFPYSGFDPQAFEACLEGALCDAPDGGVELCCSPEREAWMYEGAAALDVWPTLRAIRVPVLLVLGEHSAVPAELQRRLAAVLPELRVEEIPGATHFAALEQPQRVGEALARFDRALLR